MSNPLSKPYTLEQCACMVEQYFRTNSYKIALGRFKKKFKEVPYPKTIRVVERFLTAYTLEDEPRSGRPHTLSDEDRTELREQMEEHPGTSARHAAQQLDHKCETVRKTLKEEGFFPYRISVLHELKPEDCSPCYDYCDWFFNKFAVMSKQCQRFFFQMKRGFICLDT